MYIFHGTADTVVGPAIAPKTAAFYSAFVQDSGDNVVLVDGYSASHAVSSDHVGTPCGVTNGETYIENCGYDR